MKAKQIQYENTEKILVVGDGDFSFSKGLIVHCKNKGSNIVATSFDSETEVCKKYPNAKSCIQSIKQSCGRVLHGVDGTKLEECAELNQLFDVVIFNFPHSGQQRVHINRNLLLAFFTSAKCKVVFSGQIHVTLKTRPPYSNWNMEQLATEAGLVLKHICAFRPNKFPGYRHRTTDPQAKVFDPNHCKSYVFIVDRSKFPVPVMEGKTNEQVVALKGTSKAKVQGKQAKKGRRSKPWKGKMKRV